MAFSWLVVWSFYICFLHFSEESKQKKARFIIHFNAYTYTECTTITIDFHTIEPVHFSSSSSLSLSSFIFTSLFRPQDGISFFFVCFKLNAFICVFVCVRWICWLIVGYLLHWFNVNHSCFIRSSLSNIYMYKNFMTQKYYWLRISNAMEIGFGFGTLDECTIENIRWDYCLHQ